MPDIGDLAIIIIKTYGTIFAAVLILALALRWVSREQRRDQERHQKALDRAVGLERDASIIEEVDDLYGAPW